MDSKDLGPTSLYNSGMPPTDIKGRARPEPFMEHPTGQFATPVEAMTDAIQRLRMLPDWNDWITFCAQGAGQHENSYHFGEIRMRRESIDPGIPINVEATAKAARVHVSSIVGDEATYKLPGTTPLEAARIVDAIFRNDLQIRPFPDEGDNYAIGAEW